MPARPQRLPSTARPGGRWRALALGCLAILAAGTSRAASVPADLELTLEEAVYRLDLRGDAEGALSLLEEILDSPEAPPARAAEAAYHAVRAHLARHDEDRAQAVYRWLLEHHPGQAEWIAAATAEVPPRFLVKPVPWRAGERTAYRWTDPEGVVVGQSVVSIDQVELEGQRYWRLQTHILADGYRHYLVDFADGSLVPSHSTYRFRPFGEDELRALDAEGAAATRRRVLEHNPCDHEGVGYLLRQFTFRIGQSTPTALFRASESSEVEATLQVLGIEQATIAGHPSGVHEVELHLGAQRERFWFRHDASRELVRFTADGVTGELAGTPDAAAPVTRLGATPLTLRHPADWYALVDPFGARPGRVQIVFLLPRLEATLVLQLTPAERDAEEAGAPAGPGQRTLTAPGLADSHGTTTVTPTDGAVRFSGTVQLPDWELRALGSWSPGAEADWEAAFRALLASLAEIREGDR